MGKPLFQSKKTDDVEASVVLMRRIGPERFEVVTGTVKGPLLNPKVLEPNVSLMVGRETARSAVDKQKSQAMRMLGLEGDN